jgi:hypothetical protein
MENKIPTQAPKTAPIAMQIESPASLRSFNPVLATVARASGLVVAIGAGAD